MPDLSIEAFSIAVMPSTEYLPLAAFASGEILAPWIQPEETRGIPAEHLMLIATDDSVDLTGEPDVSTLALDALGPPDLDQPLILVRGLPRDANVVTLAALVHRFEWAGEDIGITHLEELGGTAVFDLVDWAAPEETGATVLICDEPLVADARSGARFAAVALRVRAGRGPLRVLDCGEGAPGAEAEDAEHRFGGIGPCDGWVALHEALTAGRVGDGDRILIQVRVPQREGWVLMRSEATADLLLARGEVPDAVLG